MKESTENKMDKLALHGGKKTILSGMPKRKAFGCREKKAILEAVDYYSEQDEDPGYYGRYEKRFCSEFNQYMGGGYSVAVATGTGSIYVALAALELPKGSHVVLSPITDPGTLNAIVLLGYKVSLADSKKNSFNTSWEHIEKVLTPETTAIVLVHCAGIPADIANIALNAKMRNIKLLEDCSQASGAEYKGKKLGTFGDIAALSTMYRKSIASGGSGGLVYCQDKALYYKAMSYSDRGKDFSNSSYEERNADQYMFPALNWNTDEFSCAIGSASLSRLDETIRHRALFSQHMTQLINSQLSACYVPDFVNGTSPFFLTVYIKPHSISCSKQVFCNALLAEGVELNPHYRFVVSQWLWASDYFTIHHLTPNALSARDNSFNLYLNENYTADTAEKILSAILKVENFYLA